MSVLADLFQSGNGWLAAFFVLAAWWVKGMGDRARAKTEGKVADAGVSADLVAMLRDEVKRLAERVTVLEDDKTAQARIIADVSAKLLAETAKVARQEIEHNAQLAKANLLRVAAEADAQILRIRLAHEGGLVEATMANAHETARVADAAEAAVGETKAKAKP